MTQIILDADQLSRLRAPGTSVDLCDPSGRVVGYFVPVVDLSQVEFDTPEIGEEELDRREQSTEWYSTESGTAPRKCWRT